MAKAKSARPSWRGGRIKQIQRAVSHMLVIFPFEEAIYRAAGVPVTYIGHPLAETIPMLTDQDAARRSLNLPLDARVVTVMPGSRSAELKHLSVPFVQAVKLLAARDPGLRFIAPMAGPKQRAQFTALVAAAGLGDVPITLIDNATHAAIAAADAVLVASGTATLEVALHKKPMVIAYKVVWASWQLMRHMGYLPWIGLPNILAREFLVPELQRRGIYKEQYAAGTLREKLFGDGARLGANHPGAGYRDLSGSYKTKVGAGLLAMASTQFA